MRSMHPPRFLLELTACSPCTPKIVYMQEAPRQAQNKMVQAHEERAETVTEEVLAKILTGRR